MQVFATREGLIGHTTASGYVIEQHVPFVALPSRSVLRRAVRVSRNGLYVYALVLDVGPHYTDDDDYVLWGQRPRAEGTAGSNHAGIDLGEYVWRALGMKNNGDVFWSFTA